MPINLRGRNVLTLEDFTPAEIRFLIQLAAELKAAKLAGTERPRLSGRNVALIFEKDSTRTRTGFEVAAYDQGAHVTYIDPAGEREFPISLNPLVSVPEDERHLVAERVLSIFVHLWKLSPEKTPRLPRTIYQCLRALLDRAGAV